MQKYRASALNRATLLLGASATALLFTTPALAKADQQPAPPPTDQTPPARNPQSAAQTPPKTQVPSSGGDAAVTSDQRNIVVTGTRIRQPEFTSPDPVARIDPVIAKESGKLDTADMLQSSPIAAGSNSDHVGAFVQLRNERWPWRRDDRLARTGSKPHLGPSEWPPSWPRRNPRWCLVFRPQRPSAVDRRASRHPEDRRFVDLRFGCRCRSRQPHHENRFQWPGDRWLRECADQEGRRSIQRQRALGKIQRPRPHHGRSRLL